MRGPGGPGQRYDRMRCDARIVQHVGRKTGKKLSFSPVLVYLVAISYLTVASSAAVHGVVRETVAARIDATLAAETGAPLLPH